MQNILSIFYVFTWLRIGTSGGSCEHDSEFIVRLSEYELFVKVSAPGT